MLLDPVLFSIIILTLVLTLERWSLFRLFWGVVLISLLPLISFVPLGWCLRAVVAILVFRAIFLDERGLLFVR